jgi:hypothetical protein
MVKVNVEIKPRTEEYFRYQWVVWTDAVPQPNWYLIREECESDGGITQTLGGAKRAAKRAVKRIQKVSKAGIAERTISYTVED